MAKATVNPASVANSLIADAENGIFYPVYLLMGDEPFYVDRVCDAVVSHALTEDERDFNQLICYGADVKAEDIVSNARRYPMFADRQLVVVKEAQAVKGLEELSVYTDAPLDSTVLVLVYRGGLDKRKSLYKSISKNGKVLESTVMKDYEMPRWISEYYASKGCSIDPDAAVLLAESAGTDLNKIAVESDKLFKNLPEGTTHVTVKDIEANVGISKEFSIFELTKQLSYKQTAQALRTAAYISASAKFAMPMATAALFNHFSRILKYNALLMQNSRPAPDEISRLLGVNPYFVKEYDAAIRNYPLRQSMMAIALLKEYDFKGKGGDSGEADASQLLMELITKLLNLR